jgi:hypothetical protein
LLCSVGTLGENACTSPAAAYTDLLHKRPSSGCVIFSCTIKALGGAAQGGVWVIMTLTVPTMAMCCLLAAAGAAESRTA